jgi:succinate dehydrogenase / fumarate reductase flavoprotein subunit
MQGLADGYFILPYTIGDYLATAKFPPVKESDPAPVATQKDVHRTIERLMSVGGKTPADDFHRQLGKIMWDKVGMGRSKKGLEEALREIPKIREGFWKDVKVVGTSDSLNSELERAARVADFLELGELVARDALHRKESCGGHFREEFQTEEGEARRDDKNFAYVAAWEHAGEKKPPKLHKEPLTFEYVKPSQRSYK